MRCHFHFINYVRYFQSSVSSYGQSSPTGLKVESQGAGGEIGTIGVRKYLRGSVFDTTHHMCLGPLARAFTGRLKPGGQPESPTIYAFCRNERLGSLHRFTTGFLPTRALGTRRAIPTYP